MTFLNLCAEVDEEDGGRVGHAQISIKPIAYLRDGSYRRMQQVMASTGDAAYPLGADELLSVKIKPRIAGESPIWEIRPSDRKRLARFTLLNANNVEGRAVGEGAWVYPNALNNADLSLSYGGHRFAADLLLQKGHPSSVSWSMDGNGFDPQTMMLGDVKLLQPVLIPPDGEAPVAPVPLKWEVSEKSSKYILRCTLPKGDFAGWTLYPTVVLQHGPNDGNDTLLHSLQPTNNYGALTYAMSLLSPALVTLRKFDVSAIAPSATCDLATLTIVNQYTCDPSSFRFFNLTQANQGWVEGTKLGALAGTGEPCHNARRADGAGGVLEAWAGAAGCSVSGVDYEATELGTLTLAVRTSANSTNNVALSPSRVQQWWSVPSNYGILETGLTPSKAITTYTSEFSTAARRPKLTINYTLGGGPILGSAIFVSGLFYSGIVR